MQTAPYKNKLSYRLKINMDDNSRDRKSILRRRIIILLFFILIDSCILFKLHHKNKVDPVEIEQHILTEKYGEMAINILEEHTKDWDDKKVEVTGIRVLSYTENSSLIIIGCTEETFDIEYPNRTSHIEDFWSARIYAFEFTNDAWKLTAGFLLDCESYHCSWESTVRDWWYFNEEGKAIIGELPEFKYWECIYPPDE